jgi:hypothetical protein
VGTRRGGARFVSSYLDILSCPARTTSIFAPEAALCPSRQIGERAGPTRLASPVAPARQRDVKRKEST